MVVDIGMVDPAMLTEETGESERERFLVENQMASVVYALVSLYAC